MSGLLLEDEALRAPAGNAGRFGGRWRLVSAGLSNVWRYGDLVLPAASGRLLLRGPNGTGKTTALEALWPFLLDLDKTRLQAGKSRTTTLTSLMREGHNEKKRIGYAWLTFEGPGEEGVHSYGARLVFSNGSTPSVKVEPFTIPGEPIDDMPLSGPGRATITTSDAFRDLVEAVGGTVFADEAEYVTALGNHVFGADRVDLVALADRVRKVRNPSLLAETSADKAAEALREALPGVSSDVVEATGEALAATDETRAAFSRDEEAAGLLGEFAEVWAGHAADVAGRVADEAEQARVILARARRHAAGESARHDAAVQAADESASEAKRAEEELAEANAQIEAIEKSPAYATIGRLADLRQATQALTAEADARIGVLAEASRTLHRDAKRLLDDVRQLADDVGETCSKVADADAGAPAVAISLTTRPHAVLSVGDHLFDPGSTVDLPNDPEELARTRDGWTALARRQDARANGAELMLREHRKVSQALYDAERKAADAARAEESAERAVQERDRKTTLAEQAADGAAGEIAEWAVANRALTEDDDADPLDTDTILEIAAQGPALLLDAADGWSQGAVRRAATLAAGYEAQALDRDRLAAALVGEAEAAHASAAELRAGKVLPPPRPDWAGPAEDLVFSHALQWHEHTDHTTRAHVESALAAAGILGATLGAEVLRSDGWQITADLPRAGRNLAELVDVDPSHPHSALAREVLERIALVDTVSVTGVDAGTVVGLDGTFRVGVVSGRSPGTDDPAAVPVPSHVGAAQRRAAALAEADRLDELADRLDAEAGRHRDGARALRDDAVGIRRRAAAFPSTRALRERERERSSAAQTAATLRRTADEAGREADRATQAARGAATAWREKVTAMELPPDPERLAEAHRAAGDAARTLREGVLRLAGHLDRLLRLRARADEARQDREALPKVHAAALTAHKHAYERRLAYERLEAEHGHAAADLAARLDRARRSAADREETSAAARLLAEDAGKAAAATEADARHAEGEAAAKEPAAHQGLARLRSLMAVRDIAETVLAGQEPRPGNELIAQVRTQVASLGRFGRKKVADTYESVRARLAGVWAVDRAEGYGDLLDTYQCTYDGGVLTPRAAANLAQDLARRARDRLHEAEESALRDFIVGRLPAAISAAWVEMHDWADAVNRKMGSASASSGVGVRVRLTLRDDLSPTQRTVHRLACRKSAATRTAEEDRELAAALKTLLDVADGDTVTERVRQAVEVRDWVRVDYFVHRPGHEPKRWTHRTGLSGGERRLVILAPMLASIAALHDNLPVTALRLAALDEVPVEVDEQGREGLARYIAELDLDVICTSYLWDGAPGAWDGVDAHDLEAAEGVVVAFPMLVRGLEPLPGDPEPGR